VSVLGNVIFCDDTILVVTTGFAYVNEVSELGTVVAANVLVEITGPAIRKCVDVSGFGNVCGLAPK
jgi:hypothetical protein